MDKYCAGPNAGWGCGFGSCVGTVHSSMPLHPFAGQPPPPNLLADIPRLITAYYTRKPDPGVPTQRVSFGTSGHRGSSPHASFNEGHILAITQAICQYRRENGIDGPLFVAKDTHA